MVNYQKGKIYRIVCNTTDETYIGSTVQTLSRRLATHNGDYRRWKRKKRRYISSFTILERENYQIVLLEAYPCNNKEELCFRERFYIEKYPQCLNRIRRPITTSEEQHERFDNWYENNKPELLIKIKEYRNANKEFYKEYLKQYYIQNSEKQRVKYTCECGTILSICGKARHERASAKHINYFHNLNLI